MWNGTLQPAAWAYSLEQRIPLETCFAHFAGRAGQVQAQHHQAAARGAARGAAGAGRNHGPQHAQPGTCMGAQQLGLVCQQRHGSRADLDRNETLVALACPHALCWCAVCVRLHSRVMWHHSSAPLEPFELSFAGRRTCRSLRLPLPQAKEFNETVQLSGIILTKLDGTARGGAVVSTARPAQHSTPQRTGHGWHSGACGGVAVICVCWDSTGTLLHSKCWQHPTHPLAA